MVFMSFPWDKARAFKAGLLKGKGLQAERESVGSVEIQAARICILIKMWYNLGRDYATPVRVTRSGVKYGSNCGHPPGGIVSRGMISCEYLAKHWNALGNLAENQPQRWVQRSFRECPHSWNGGSDGGTKAQRKR